MNDPRTEGEIWASCPCFDIGCGCEEIVLTGEEVVALVDVDKKPGTLTATLEDDGFVLAKDPANAWAYDELMKIRHA